MSNQPYYQGADLVADEQYSESKIVNKIRSEQASRARRLQTKQPLHVIERSEKNAGDIVQRVSPEHVQDNSLSELHSSEELASSAKEEKNIVEIDMFNSDIAVSTPVQNKRVTEKSAEVISALTKHPDYQQLDTLLQKVLFYRQKKDMNQDSLNAAEPPKSSQSGLHIEVQNSVSAQKIQVELFELLFKYKQDDPKLLVAQKYLNVLSQEQVRELMTMSEVEVHE